jgi:hypothetical protein
MQVVCHAWPGNTQVGFSRVTRLRNITRIDHEASSTYAWRATLQRWNGITVKTFSDSVHNGKRKALKAAIEYRNALLLQHSPFKHQVWLRTRLRRNNTSGIPGVARYEVVANQKTGRLQVFWLAYWVNEHGTRRQRKFFISSYGEQQAKRLAIAERTRQLNYVCAIKCAQP